LENSSIEGFMIEDEINFEENMNKNKAGTRVAFGCTINENNHFYLQEADGIIGLGPGKCTNYYILKANLIGQLYSEGIIDSPIFSICLGLNGGFITLGNGNQSSQTESAKFTPIYDKMFYSVKLENIIILGQALQINNEIFTVLDSGTTISYFPSDIFNRITNLIELFCSQNDKCIGVSYKKFSERGICFVLDKNSLESEFIRTLPDIILTFENNLQYKWTAENYIFNMTSLIHEQLKFCMGFVSWDSNEILLGTSFMHNHNIIFDNFNNRIGISEHNCIKERITKESIVKPECETKNLYYKKIIIIHVVIVIFLIIILIMIYCRISRGRDFICMKLVKDKTKIKCKNSDNNANTSNNTKSGEIKRTSRIISEIKITNDFGKI
jgi:hypothetical protein